jgi:replicative DNA helicase
MDEGQVVDLVTVAARWPIAIGSAFPMEVATYGTEVPSARNVEHYARVVRDHSRAVRLRRVGLEISEAAESMTADEAMRHAQTLLRDATIEAFGTAPVSVGDEAARLFSLLEAVAARGREEVGLAGLATGFPTLDAMTSGLPRGNLVLVAGRPSMGKTAFSLQLAAQMAARGSRGLFFSLEQSRAELVMRLVAQAGQVSLSSMRSRMLKADEWHRFGVACSDLEALPLMIDESRVSLATIRAKAWVAKHRDGLDVIVIDYVGLMDRRRGSAHERTDEIIGEISAGLKALAKELDIVAVLLSQLNRQPEMRPNHRPMLSDLRDSGSLEQDADLVMFLYRDEHYNKETNRPGVIEIIVAKARNGPIGTVPMRWVAERCLCVDTPQENLL